MIGGRSSLDAEGGTVPPIIVAEGLSKTFRIAAYQRSLRGLLGSVVRRRYSVVEAVRQATFAVEPGICLGLIGPNGAGKSTTIKMMTGVLHPSAGVVRVNGLVPFENRQQSARQIGVVFGQRSQLWYDLPVIDSYCLLRAIYEIPRSVYDENLHVYGERLGLPEFFHQPVRKLSLGQRMRADFAAALLHNPRVVFLDEPTIGLDVVAKEAVRDFIRFMCGERAVTVILTTHDMSDIEAVSHRVLVMDRGTIIRDSTMATLRDTFGRNRLLVIQLRDADSAARLAADSALLGQLGVAVTDLAGHDVTIQFSRDRYTAFDLVGQVARAYPVEDIETREVPIEAIIRSIYTGAATTMGVPV
jgi:ABC-2 type transport system ATP-binding protein